MLLLQQTSRYLASFLVVMISLIKSPKLFVFHPSHTLYYSRKLVIALENIIVQGGTHASAAAAAPTLKFHGRTNHLHRIGRWIRTTFDWLPRSGTRV